MRFNSRTVVGLLSAGLLYLQSCAYAQELPSGTLDIDLSSTQQSVSASNLSEFNSVSITVGESSRTVTPTDFLTPAETVAVMQMLGQGQQTIQLGSMGQAVGGSFAITSQLATNLTNLVIPQGVTAIGDFGILSSLNLTGNLTNAGTFYAVSSSSAVTEAAISAANISNLSNATISSVLPTGGIPGCSNLSTTLSLILNATNNIYNAGTISSAGNLTLSAGGSITNLSAVNSMSAIMQAVNNVSLMSANIVNSGIIAAKAGNINIASAMAQDIVVNNIGGRLEAALGSINIRDASFSAKNHALLWGGDLISKALNVYSGNGIATINVHDLIGTTNIYAGEAHVRAATNSLNLGTIELTGDPTFYNTLGDVTINAPLVFGGAPLAIVAKGNIVTATGVGNIKTSSTTGNGGAITMIAGADVHLVDAGPDSVLPGSAGDTTTQLEIRGASSTGGNIILTGPNILSLESEGSTSSGTGDGGNITLIAFASPNEELEDRLGRISLPTGVTIKAGGRDANGNVTIIAGAKSGAAVTVGSININSLTAGSATNMNGSEGTTKNFISIHAATPTLTENNYVYIEDGVMTGSFTPGEVQNANISVQVLTAKAGNMTLAAGGSITTTTITNNSATGTGSYDGGKLVIESGGDITTGTVNVSAVTSGKGGEVDIAGEGVVSTSSITVNATSSGAGGIVSMYGGTSLSPGALNANGTTGNAGGKVTLSGGDVILTSIATAGGPLAVVASGNITTAAAAAGINTSTSTANGGAITMVAGAAFTRVSTKELEITGPSSTGGIVRLTTPNVNAFDSRGSSVSGSGSGGDIVVVAYANPTDGSLGTISIPTSIQLLASGRGTGSNGSVTLIAGGASGTTISMDGMNSSVGAAGTGDIMVATAIPTISGSLEIDSGAVESGSFTLGTQTSAGVSIGNYVSAADIYIKTSSVTDIQSITTSAPGGHIDIVSDGSLSIAASAGTGVLMQATGAGANAITLTALGGAITLADDRTFDAGTGGTVSFISDIAGGAINIAANNTVTIANSIGVLRAPNISLLGTSSRITSSKTTGTGLIIDNGTIMSALTIRGADNTSGTISSSGATVLITANSNQDLVFAKAAGTNNSTININAPTTMNTTNSSVIINSSVTVATDKPLVFNVDNGTFSYNGTISSSDTSIRVQSTGSLILTGTSSNTISISGSNASIIVSAASELVFSSNFTFNPGTSGTVNFSSPMTVALDPGVTLTINGGSALASAVPLLTVSTPLLTLDNATAFIVNKTSNTGAQFTSPTSFLGVLISDNGTATIQTTGSSINFLASGGSGLIDIAKGAGGNSSTLLLNGGAVTMNSGNAISIGAQLSLSSNKNITLASNVVTNNGLVTTSLAAGSIIFSTGTNKVLNGTGTYSVTGGGAASIQVQQNQASPNLTLTLNDELTFNAGSAGTVTFTVNPTTAGNNGSLLIGDDSTVYIAGGSALTINAHNVAFGNNSSINSSKTSGTAIVFGPADAPALTLSVAGNSTANIITAGGSIALQPASSQNLVFNNSTGTGEATFAFVGGAVTMTTTSTGSISTNANAKISAGSLTLTAATGSINVVTAADSIAASVTTNANITIAEYDSVTLNTISTSTSGTAGTVSISAGGSIDANGVITSRSLILQTTSNNGNITFNANASGSTGVVVQTDGTGSVTVAATKTVSTTNTPLSITAGDINIQGSLSAGTSSLSIKPNAVVTDIILGGASEGSLTDTIMNISASDLSHLTATTLTIGDLTQSAQVSLEGSVNTSSRSFTQINLLSAADYVGTGYTFTVSAAQALTIQADSIYTGAISSPATLKTLTLVADESVVVDGQISWASSGAGLPNASSYGRVEITTPSIDILAPIAANGAYVGLHPLVSTISLAGEETSNPATFDLSSAEINSVSAGRLSLDNFSANSLVELRGDLSFTNPNLKQVYIDGLAINNGTTFDGTGHLVTITSATELFVQVTNIALGSITTNGKLQVTSADLNNGLITVSGTISSSANITFATPTLTNNGTINTSQTLTVQPSAGITTLLSVNGSGQLGATTLNITNSLDGISVSQVISNSVTVNITGSGNISTAGTISGQNVTLTTTGTNKSLSIDGDINGSINVTLIANAGAAQSITVYEGNVVSGQSISIQTPTLIVNGSVEATQGVNIGKSGTFSSVLDVSGTGQIQGPGGVSVTNSNGGVNVAGLTVNSQSGTVGYSAAGNLALTGGMTSGAGLTYQTTANNGNITIANDSRAVASAIIKTNGSGLVDIQAAGELIVETGPSSISTADLIVDGSITTNAGTLRIEANGTQPITLANTSEIAGTLNISMADLENIQTSALTIGSTELVGFDTGGIVVLDTVDVSQLNIGATLYLNNKGNFDSSGAIINIGEKNLYISSELVAVATITGTSGDLVITSTQIDQSTGMLSANYISLGTMTGSGNGNIGSEGASVNTSANRLYITSTNNAYVVNDGAVILGSNSFANGDFKLTADHITTEDLFHIYSHGSLTFTTSHLSLNQSLEADFDLTIQSMTANGDLVIDGNEFGRLQSMFGNLVLQAGINNTLNIASDVLEVAPVLGGTVTLQGGAVNFGDSTQFLMVNSAQVAIVAESVEFGADTLLDNFGGTLTISDGGIYQSVSLYAPAGEVGTISSTEFSVTPTSGIPVYVRSTNSSIPGTLNLSLSMNSITTDNSLISIDEGAVLTGDTQLVLTANSGDILINGSIVGNGGIYLSASSVTIEGSLYAPGGNVEISPDSNVPITIGNVSKELGFVITPAELQKVSGFNLIIGGLTNDAGITILDDIDISSPNLDLGNLVLFDFGDIQSTGATILLGTSNLQLDSGAHLTVDSIQGNGSAVQLRADTFELLGSIEVGNTGSVLIQPTADQFITIGTMNHTYSAFDITESEMQNIHSGQLIIGSFYFGSGATLANNISLTSSGLGSYDLSIWNNGTFDADGHTIALSNNNLLIGSGNTISMAEVTSTSDVLVDLKGTSVGISAPINANSGKVVLRPSASSPVTVGGNNSQPGQFDVTVADLQNISAGTVEIGDMHLDGGLSLGGDLNTAASYDLTFANGGLFNDNGFSVDYGNNNFTVYQQGGSTNTATGDLDLTRVLSANPPISTANPFSAVAGGSIFSDVVGVASIEGASINIAAGVNFSLDSSGSVQINGNSQSGGNVLLPTTSLTSPGNISASANSGTTADGLLLVGNISKTVNAQQSGNVNLVGTGDLTLGNLNLSGSNGLWGSNGSNGSAGANGGQINITTQQGDITISSITSRGGVGGSIFGSGQGGSGGVGGNGGNVVISTANGNISILGSVEIAGGNGGFGARGSSVGPGQPNTPGGDGGNGGHGGDLTLVAANGDVFVGAEIVSYGGDGGGGRKGGSLGSGGTGGLGGSVLLQSIEGELTVNGKINTSGGGGGGTEGGENTVSSQLRTVAGGGGGGGGAGSITLNSDNDMFVQGDLLAFGGGGGGGTAGTLGAGYVGLSGLNGANGAQGGSGGLSSRNELTAIGSGGGGGGGGADIHLISHFGNITILGWLNSSGGGGGGGGGATFGSGGIAGLGGGGGYAGNISVITDNGNIIVQGPILAAGGGAGGAGGSSGAGGGGGGSFGGGGAGGSGSTQSTFWLPGGGGGGGYRGGSGAGDQLVPSSFGGSSSDQNIPVYGAACPVCPPYLAYQWGPFVGTGGNGFGPSGIEPGHGGGFGEGGTANGGTTGATVGQNATSGELGGNGGVIEISSLKLNASSTIATSGIPVNANSTFANYSIYTNASVDIQVLAGISANTQYSQNGDLESTVRSEEASIDPLALTVGSINHGNGILGAVHGTSGSVINSGGGVDITSGSFAPSIGKVAIKEGKQNRAIAHEDMVSPSEYFTLVQIAEIDEQKLVLDASATASNGTFELNGDNLPSSGFTKLAIPNDVIGTSEVQELRTSEKLLVNGQLDLKPCDCTHKLITPLVEVNGVLNVQGNTPSLNILENGDPELKGTGIVAMQSVDGGSFTMGGTDIILDPSTLDIGPKGANGNGAKIILHSSGRVRVNGSLNVNGNGTGHGGLIDIVYHHPGSSQANDSFLISGVLIGNQSGVTGNITADSIGGQGGSIAIFNSASDLRIRNHGLVSANYSLETGNLGDLRFNSNGTVVIDGSGELKGKITANGTSISIDQTLSQLWVKEIEAAEGDVSLTAGDVVFIDQSVVRGRNIYVDTSKTIQVFGTAALTAAQYASLLTDLLDLQNAIDTQGIVTSPGNLNSTALALRLGPSQQHTSYELTIRGPGLVHSDNQILVNRNPNESINGVKTNPDGSTEVVGHLSLLKLNILTTDTNQGAHNLDAPETTIFTNELTIPSGSFASSPGHLVIGANSVDNSGRILAHELKITTEFLDGGPTDLDIGGANGRINAPKITFQSGITVSVAQKSIIGKISAIASENIIISTSQDDLILGKLNAVAGTISITTNGSQIVTTFNSRIASLGTVAITSSGIISLGVHSQIVVNNGHILLTAGSTTGTLSSLEAPSGLTIKGSTPGLVRASSSNIDLNDSNVANSNWGEIVFQHGTDGGKISLGGDVYLLTGTVGQPMLLSNLDLMDSETQAILTALQLGTDPNVNNLSFDENGAYGSMTIDAINLNSSLSSLDITADATINLTGISQAVPLNIEITAANSRASITGVLNLISTSASDQSLINISSTQSGIGLEIGSTGQLSAGAKLSLSSDNIVNSGQISAGSNLSVTTGNLTNAGLITSTGSNTSIVITNGTNQFLYVNAPDGSTGVVSAANDGSGLVIISNTNEGALSFQNAASAGMGTLELRGATVAVNGSGGAITFSSGANLVATSDISVTNTNGDIIFGSNLSATDKIVTITVEGQGSIVSTGGAIYASAVYLVTEQDDIGTIASSIETTVEVLSINAGGNAFVTNASAVSVGQSTVGGQLQVVANGNIDVLDQISGNSVNLQALTGSQSSVAIAANVEAVGEVQIIADGAGAISQTTGSIFGSSVNLESNSGAIGSLLSPISVTTENLTISTNADSFITSDSDLTVTVPTIGSAVVITTSGSLSLTSSVESLGDISFNTLAMLHIPVGLTVTSTSGQVTIGADRLDIQGNISAPSGAIVIYSTGTRDVVVGSASTSPNAFDLNASVLAKLSASNLVIGNSTMTGNITVNGDINTATIAAIPIEELTFATTGNFSSISAILNIGSSSLNISVNGITQINNLTGATPTLALSGNAMTIASAVSNLHVNDSSVASLSLTNAGNIFVDENLSVINNSSLITIGNTTIDVTTSGMISSSSGSITLSARSLSLSGMITVGTGSVTIYPNDNQSIKFGSGSGTGGVFDLNLSRLSHISAGSLVIGKSNLAGNINLGGNIDFGTVISGSLTNLSFLTAGTYNSNSNSITMGSGQLVVTSGGVLTSHSISGSSPTIALTGNNGVELYGTIATTTGSISVTSNSWLGIAATINLSNGGSLSITQQGGNGPLILNSNIGGTSSTVTISAAAWQGIAQWSGVVTANSLTLSSPGGDIGTSSSRLNIAASSLTVNSSNRNVYITNSGPLTLNSSTAGHFNLLNNNNITIGGALSASSTSLVTTANNGSIQINSNITSPNYLDLVVHGSGSITQSSGLISTSSLALISSSGNFGSSANKLNTNTFYLLARTSGDAYVNSSGSVYVHQWSNANIMYIHAGGQLEVGATITAPTLTLDSSGTIIVTGNINATTATLHASGNGNILRNNGIIYTTNLDLSTGTGTIGTTGNKVQTTASNISASNSGGLHLNSTNTGVVTATSIASGYVNLSVSGSLNATGDITGTYGIEVTSGGAMTINDASTTNGSMSFTAGGGTLTIASGSVISANEGNLNIRNSDTTNGLILIDSGANIGAFTVGTPNATKGNVTITIGAPPATPTAGSTPSNVTECIVNGGQIFYGTNGIDTSPTTNYLNAIGGTMIFDTGGRSSSAITLGGGVTITADPPIIPDESALPSGPDASINLGLSDVVIQSHQLDPSMVSPLFRPIAYTSSIAPNEEVIAEPLKGLAYTEFGTSTIRHSPFSKFNIDNGEYISHYAGDILVEAKSRAVKVVAGKHSIQIAPNTVVLISKDAQLVRVVPLYESGSNAVRVSSGNLSVRVFPGQEVMLGDNSEVLARIMRNDSIARRRMHTQDLPSGQAISRCEISSMSLIENNFLLAKLVRSEAHCDRQLTNKFIKTAASLMTITSSHGSYVTGISQ